MKPRTYYLALLSLSLLISNAVQANDQFNEIEDNSSFLTPQKIEAPTGNATITAILGKITGSATNDLDFYTFSGQEGDVVTLDIDGGAGGLRSVDTVIAIFGSDGKMLRLNDDAAKIDDGSTSRYDSMIENFKLSVSGEYVVGVSNYPRYFISGGTVTNPTRFQNGDYKLNITGVTPPVLQINIDIKPGNDGMAPINPKSRGKIPVALLSSSNFNAMDADIASLTFGSTGKEVSLSHCNPEGIDVNNDGLIDLFCHFENQLAGFVQGDLEATLRGKLKQGTRFEGQSVLKVVGEKRSGF